MVEVYRILLCLFLVIILVYVIVVFFYEKVMNEYFSLFGYLFGDDVVVCV